MRTLISIVGMMVILMLGVGCEDCVGCPHSVSIYYPIELGNEQNSINIHKTFYLGHRVERFRLKVRFINPGRTDQWISDVILFFDSNGGGSEQFESLPSSHDSDGSFWTQEFTNNNTQININSNGAIVQFQGGQPRFEIVEVEYYYGSSTDRRDIPNPSDSNIVFLSTGRDVVGFSPDLSEAQHYIVEGSDSISSFVSLYVSPRDLDVKNITGIKIYLSPTGFVDPDANVSWIEPEPGDSGIYVEYPLLSGQKTYVTVRQTLIVPYLIKSTSLVGLFGDIVMERDAQMGSAPATDVDAIENSASQQSPFNPQIANYLRENADFDRRINEMMTLASAFSLDASNGQMRFSSAELHRDISFWRNVDVQFSICNSATDPTACRANAGSSRINMFDIDLSNPVSAGLTFHHEWGHWEYGLPDEYVDVSGPPPTLYSAAVDPNSLMGTYASTEFCTENNHFYLTSDGEQDSSWTQILDQYGSLTRSPTQTGDMSQGRYLDVLHKLDDLIGLTFYR